MSELCVVWSLSGTPLAVVPVGAEPVQTSVVPQLADVDVERLGSIASLFLASNKSRLCHFEVAHVDHMMIHCGCAQGSRFIVCLMRTTTVMDEPTTTAPLADSRRSPNVIRCWPLLLLLLLEASMENNLKRPLRHVENPLAVLQQNALLSGGTPDNSTHGGVVPTPHAPLKQHSLDAANVWVRKFVPDVQDWWRSFAEFCETLNETEESRKKKSNAMGSAEVLAEDRKTVTASAVAANHHKVPLQRSVMPLVRALHELSAAASPHTSLWTTTFQAASLTYESDRPVADMDKLSALVKGLSSDLAQDCACLSSLWWPCDVHPSQWALGSVSGPSGTTLLLTTHEDVAVRWRSLHTMCCGDVW